MEDEKIKFWMSPKEKNFILAFLKKEDVMLEWGSGGSTLELSKHVKKYYSIEHDKVWYEKIKNILVANNNVSLHYVASDKPRSSTDPNFSEQPSSYDEFATYINYGNKLGIKFNKVLIDGRARRWCAEEIIKHLCDDAIVFIHDFGIPERQRYNSVLKFYSILGISETLVALKVK